MELLAGSLGAVYGTVQQPNVFRGDLVTIVLLHCLLHALAPSASPVCELISAETCY